MRSDPMTPAKPDSAECGISSLSCWPLESLEMTTDTADRIVIRELGADGIEPIREIDRSELIETQYTVKDGQLHSEHVTFEVPRWESEGDGDHVLSLFRPPYLPIVPAKCAACRTAAARN